MTRLISLYPRAWRDRYEMEFHALLAEKTPDPRDRIDIVRGALDARLHPQLPGAPDQRWQTSRSERLTGGLVFIAGLGWSAWLGLILRDFRGWGSGTPATGDLMIVLSIAGFLAQAIAVLAIAVTFGSSMRPIGIPGAMFATIGFGVTAFGGGMSLVVGFIGVAILAWAMAGRVIASWLAVAWTGVTVLAFLAMVGFLAIEGRAVGLLALGVPFGIAWLIVGATIAIRRSPATVDALPRRR